MYDRNTLDEKLVIFNIILKKEVLRTYVFRMARKGWLMGIIGMEVLFVILKPPKNLMLLMNVSHSV